jgi:hypothetical protein
LFRQMVQVQQQLALLESPVQLAQVRQEAE